MKTLVWLSFDEYMLHLTNFDDLVTNVNESVGLDALPSENLDVFLGIHKNKNLYSQVKMCVLNNNVTLWDNIEGYNDGKHPFLRICDSNNNIITQEYIEQLNKIICFTTTEDISNIDVNTSILRKMQNYINQRK